ncbi:MAG: hypothetical protein C4520_22070 [Candidatus Abyssobacteria bacterium SURF_5]|uniref:Uncharacterized protein n=1 Tax=Abyssobacteria bacterium (strain SURF_5) TaxID=2093360 RepID=A0A3A4NHG3_ABYX5|nr:MAG: hypothetical protein C4520_22070 [Candidatus Abyssubacteria bacterium SURF_5]
MELKKVLAGWNKVCPGCNIARKYPKSFIGRKVRAHWENGCPVHDAYVEVYGANEPTSKKKASRKNAPKKKVAAKAGAGNPGKPQAKGGQKKKK